MNIKSNEKKENSIVELVIAVDAAEFEAAVEKVYHKQKKNIMIPGFRKGKAPRKMVEKMYGAEIFYDDAISEAYPAAYDAALKEAGVEPVAYPTLEVLEVGKDGFTFKATITVKPQAAIKGYKGLTVAKPEVKVSAADVKGELKPYIDRASRLVSVERKAKKGDVVIIDFEGFKDGVPFDGGKGEHYNLELGSGSFVPGFEDQVIGMKAGEEKDLDITFPEDYAAELAGAAVVFKVKVQEVKEKQEPELDDEFAKDVSEFDTLDEFKKDLGEKLKARRQEQADREFENAIVDQLIEKLECEVPQAMVDFRADKMMEDYALRIQSQGMSFEDYLKMMGLTVEDMRAQAKPAAERAVRRTLALEAVAAAEGIEVSDADVDAEFDSLAEEYKMPAEQVRAIVNPETVRQDLIAKRAFEVVKCAVKKPVKKAAAKSADSAKENSESAAQEEDKKQPIKKASTKSKPKTQAAEKTDQPKTEDND